MVGSCFHGSASTCVALKMYVLPRTRPFFTELSFSSAKIVGSNGVGNVFRLSNLRAIRWFLLWRHTPSWLLKIALTGLRRAHWQAIANYTVNLVNYRAPCARLEARWTVLAKRDSVWVSYEYFQTAVSRYNTPSVNYLFKFKIKNAYSNIYTSKDIKNQICIRICMR